MTAILAVPILLAAGMSVELAGVRQKKKDFQNALDAATLAAAARGQSFNPVEAMKYFQPSSQSIAYVAEGPSFSRSADGVVTSSVKIAVPTQLLRIGGFTSITISLTSAAIGVKEAKISEATFQIKRADGAYDKDFYFFTRDAAGNILSEQLILQYNYDVQYDFFNVKVTKTYTPETTETNTIKIGSYASYGYEMVVYEDKSLLGQHINPKKYYSDAANASTFQRQTGTCNSASGQTNYWEDGGNSDYDDFVFKTTCTESTVLTGDARLTQ